MFHNNKISVRQFCLIFVMTTLSPAIRILPLISSKIAGPASWLAPVVALLPFVLLIFILDKLFKNKEETNFSDATLSILGRPIGTAVISIYLAWIILLSGLYLRYYAERILSSIMPNSSMEFLLIVILVLVYFVARGSVEHLARLTELMFVVFAFVFVLTNVFAFFDVDLLNLLPVSYKDIGPIIRSSPGTLGVWAYLTFITFFADKVNNAKRLKRAGIITAISVTIASIVIIAVTVGVLGADMTSRVSLSYFTVIKNISVLSPLNRLEPIVLSMWIISDFITLAIFAHMIISILKSLFNLSEKKSFVSPLVILLFALGFCISKNRFELELFSANVAIPVNLILGFGVPLLLFVVGKIRKAI